MEKENVGDIIVELLKEIIGYYDNGECDINQLVDHMECLFRIYNRQVLAQVKLFKDMLDNNE